MSKDPVKPKSSSLTGRKMGTKTAHATRSAPGKADMRIGSPSCLGDRKGRFSGTGSDVRDKGRAFKSGLPGPAGPRGGGGAGHKGQSGGHSNLAKGGSFNK